MKKLALLLILCLTLTGAALAETAESLGTLYDLIAGDRTITGEIFRANGPDEPVSVDLIDAGDPARDFGLTAILQYERAYAEWPEADAAALIDGEEPAASVELTFDDGTSAALDWYRGARLVCVTEGGEARFYRHGLSLDYYMEGVIARELAEAPSSLGTLYEAIAGDRTITGEIFRANGPDEPVNVDLIDTDDPARDFGLMAILQYERAYCAYPEEDFYHQEPDVTVALTFGDGTGVSINWYRSEPSLILVTDDETGRKDCYATGLSLDYYMEGVIARELAE